MADLGPTADHRTNGDHVASPETRPHGGGDLVRLKTDAEMRAKDDTRGLFNAVGVETDG